MGKPLSHLNLTWIMAFLLPWSLSSCQKDELTQPTEVTFQFKLDRMPSQNNSVSFHEGTMDIKSITFIGDRQNGENASFISDFATIVHADLGSGNTDPLIQFDIPQGTYNRISLSVDPDNTEPDIVVTGRYVPTLPGPPTPIQLEINLTGQLNLIAKSLDGNADIILRKDSRTTFEIFLNPSLWFTDFPLITLETAELQNIRGVPSIVISKDFNPEMYLKLVNLIEVSAEAVLK